MPRNLWILLFGAGLATAAAAQQNFDLPTLRNNPQNNNYPFAGPPMRYQQWFSALEWQLSSPKPIRVTGMWFLAGPGRNGVGGRQVDIEVTMANARPTSYTGTFDQNMISGRTVVFPRALLTLQAPSAAAFPVQVPFRSEFVWDGVSGVVVDIKLFDNGNAGQPYLYDLEYNAFTLQRTARLYTINNPVATTAATTSASTGMTIRFLYNEALPWPYGQGCPGEGGAVPEHGTEGGFPTPGNGAYTMLLTGAAPQRQALFVIGASASSWNGSPLPFDLAPIGAPGCSLLAEYIAGAAVATVGGAPGTGIARFPLPMPPTTDYVGISLFSQWLVLDPNARNGLLAVSNGIRHITAMQ